MTLVSTLLFGLLAISLLALVMLVVKRKDKRAFRDWLLTLGISFGAFVLIFAVIMYIAIGLGSPGRPFRRRGKKVVGDVECRKSANDALRQAALEEHASIASFNHLATDLIAHGAPDSLVQRVRSAAEDEARHAAILFSLTGEKPAACEAFSDYEPRDLKAIAWESLTDGYVNESASAWKMRKRFPDIAADEWRHARLGLDIAKWAATKLLTVSS